MGFSIVITFRHPQGPSLWFNSSSWRGEELRMAELSRCRWWDSQWFHRIYSGIIHSSGFYRCYISLFQIFFILYNPLYLRFSQILSTTLLHNGMIEWIWTFHGMTSWLILSPRQLTFAQQRLALFINIYVVISGLDIYWLVVSTPVKNICQLGLLFPTYGKMFQTSDGKLVSIWWLSFINLYHILIYTVCDWWTAHFRAHVCPV